MWVSAMPSAGNPSLMAGRQSRRVRLERDLGVRGRHGDRTEERSIPFVVLDQDLGLILGGADEIEMHHDAVEERVIGVAGSGGAAVAFQPDVQALEGDLPNLRL